jgi:HK97 family phage major capsid protein
MKMEKNDLVALMQSEIKSAFGTTEFSESMKGLLGQMVKELQQNIVTPFSIDQKTKLTANMSFSRIDGDYLTTKTGSVINLKNKSNPWVVVSDELGQWVKEFAGYLKSGNVSKALNETVDTAGGFLVPEEFKALMIMYDMEQTAVWTRATVWPMAGEKIAFPKLMQDPDIDSATFDHFAGVSFGWTDEGTDKPETEPNFGLIEMVVHELSGYTELTNILLDDSVINILNYITRIFRAAWYWYTDKSFIRGTGAKQPLGVLNDPAALTVTRETANTVVLQDLINMDAKMPAIFDEGSVWFYTKKIRNAIRGQKTTEGELVLLEFFNDIAQGSVTTILGRPAVLCDGKLPNIGSFGDIILGNWTNYYIGFREDFIMDSSRHFQFRKNRTALRCSGRVDGQAAIPQAFVLLDDSVS